MAFKLLTRSSGSIVYQLDATSWRRRRNKRFWQILKMSIWINLLTFYQVIVTWIIWNERLINIEGMINSCQIILYLSCVIIISTWLWLGQCGSCLWINQKEPSFLNYIIFFLISSILLYCLQIRFYTHMNEFIISTIIFLLIIISMILLLIDDNHCILRA
eukprot:439872_1